MRDYFITNALEYDAREEKLPAWARDKLATMRHATTDAVNELRELKAGTTPGPFWLQGWDGGNRYYLPVEAGRLMFGNGEDALQLSSTTNGKETGWLDIAGGTDGIIAAPRSSNVLLVRSRPRNEK